MWGWRGGRGGAGALDGEAVGLGLRGVQDWEVRICSCARVQGCSEMEVCGCSWACHIRMMLCAVAAAHKRATYGIRHFCLAVCVTHSR